MPKVRKINAFWTIKAIDVLRRQGRSADDILREAGLRRADLQGDDARVPFRKFAAFLEAAARLTQDRHFGLKMGRESEPREAGVLGYVALNSATLGDAFRNAVRYQRIENEGAEMRFRLGGREAEVEFELLERGIEDERHVIDFDMAGLYTAIEILTRREVPLLRMAFRHAGSGDPDAYREMFGVAPSFGQGRTVLVLPTSFFEAAPVVGADDLLLKILLRHAEDVLARTPAIDDLVGQVRASINARLVDGAPPIDAVAADLAMSRRTLSRRLNALGTSYRVVLDDLRYQLALDYLADPEVGLSNVAFLLGFSEISAFSHAFRRWSGKAPSAFRR